MYAAVNSSNNNKFLSNVKVIGTMMNNIKATEDREIFSASKLQEIGDTSYSTTSFNKVLVDNNKIGYPVIMQAAFALWWRI